MQPIVFMEMIMELIMNIYVHGQIICYLVKFPQK
jgi:hypothetical protein